MCTGVRWETDRTYETGDVVDAVGVNSWALIYDILQRQLAFMVAVAKTYVSFPWVFDVRHRGLRGKQGAILSFSVLNSRQPFTFDLCLLSLPCLRAFSFWAFVHPIPEKKETFTKMPTHRKEVNAA